ncbi:MAG: PP2C family serine/threonine-protein phosphatase [Actinomycetota bacterium]
MNASDEITLESDALIEWLRTRAAEPPSAWPVAAWAGDTTVGRVRAQNEDRWGVADGWLFGVADGIGGRPGGAIAAESVIQALRVVTAQAFDADFDAVIRFLNDTVLAAGATSGTPGLGTTLAALALRDSYASVFSIGDSRVYRWRDGELLQLTVDHSLRTELLEAGVDPVEYAERGMRVDALTAFVGMPADRDLPRSAGAFRIAQNDRFLICSDGVHGYVDPSEIARLVGSSAPADAVGGLLHAANANGGRDNATAIIVQIGPARAPQE